MYIHKEYLKPAALETGKPGYISIMQQITICWTKSIGLQGGAAYSNENDIPDSKVHGANMGPIWGQQNPGGPHVGPMKLANWDAITIPLATF